MKKLISSVLLLGTLVSSAIGVYADEPEKTEEMCSAVSQQAVEGSKASSAVEAYADELVDGDKRNLAALKGKSAESFAKFKEMISKYKEENPKFYEEWFNCISSGGKAITYLLKGNFWGVARTAVMDRKKFADCVKAVKSFRELRNSTKGVQ